MPFSDDQQTALKAPLLREMVKTREQGGRTLSYVEGWHVIAEANRIFGFDQWSSLTVETRCVSERERMIGKQADAGWGVTYIAKVKIMVGADNDVILREGVGAGHGIDRDLGQAHESAIKEAETDARKRALMTFGNPFGLALYDKQQTNVIDESEVTRLAFVDYCKAKISEFEDPQALLVWWNSEAEKAKRREFGLTAAELLVLKSMVTAKIPKQRTA